MLNNGVMRYSMRVESCTSVCVDTAAGVLHPVNMHAKMNAMMHAMIANDMRCAILFGINFFILLNCYIDFASGFVRFLQNSIQPPERHH